MVYDSLDDVLEHRAKVFSYASKLADILLLAACRHDASKMDIPEKELFDEYTPKLKEMEYGSEEYKKCLDGLQPALKHHYQINRHHPEHFSDGIKGMNLVDLVEFFCDNLAASKQMKDGGNILKSLEINQTRFGYSDDLKQIMVNTAKLLGE